MLSGWWGRQKRGPLRRRSFLSPTRLFSCEETPQTSQRLPSRVSECADALDFSRAIGVHSPMVKALRVLAWRLTRGAVSLPVVLYCTVTVLTLSRVCAKISQKCGKILGMYGGYTEVDGAKLKELREDRAFSVRDLAEKARVSTDTITALEKGRRKAWPRNVRKLAGALGVEPRDLMKAGKDV
jgi:DNA-binding XRE family transcriptional regulator